jgi:type I restriction-modification system DNA methylase subunit
MFHGFDFDNTMLRIGSMNMLLHGVENPDIRYRDSLADEHSADADAYTLVLANPPFAGSLDYENTAKDLLQIVKTSSGSDRWAKRRAWPRQSRRFQVSRAQGCCSRWARAASRFG